ncbi:MAG: hypothetical protein KC680_02900, partial [Candidatus Peregrinibacteria bacterium]|nr:hypothetical protein [Candidatus Peregrinibacteria bacterium]
AKALIDAALNPTVVVGTKVPQLEGRNWRKGNSDFFILEACEYRGSFLHLHPSIVLLTNIEWDHIDAYPTEEAYKKAYADFIALLPTSGIVIGHSPEELLVTGCGKQFVNVDSLSDIRLSIPGEHMVRNAKLVVALGEHLGVSVRDPLASFTGTWRRFELKGMHESGALIIDDYAHHPTEILATIASAYEKYPDRRIVCLFQPHMHGRVIALYQDFVQAFHGTTVWLTNVYEARTEEVTEQVDIQQLAEDIGENCTYVGDLQSAEEFCCKNLQQNDVLLVIGAGDCTTLAGNLVAA